MLLAPQSLCVGALVRDPCPRLQVPVMAKYRESGITDPEKRDWLSSNAACGFVHASVSADLLQTLARTVTVASSATDEWWVTHSAIALLVHCD